MMARRLGFGLSRELSPRESPLPGFPDRGSAVLTSPESAAESADRVMQRIADGASVGSVGKGVRQWSVTRISVIMV